MSALTKLLAGCMPGFKDYLNSSGIEKEPVEESDDEEVYNNNSSSSDSSSEFDEDEEMEEVTYPTIQIFGHGWDPSDSDEELGYPSYKKVLSTDVGIDMVEVYGLGHRGPYIECVDDDLSKNVTYMDYNTIPNLLISIADFKDSYNLSVFNFGILINGQDVTKNWLEHNTSFFTLKEFIQAYNTVYTDGYYLEVHTGRVPLNKLDMSMLPSYVIKTPMADEVIYEYNKEHNVFTAYNMETMDDLLKDYPVKNVLDWDASFDSVDSFPWSRLNEDIPMTNYDTSITPPPLPSPPLLDTSIPSQQMSESSLPSLISIPPPGSYDWDAYNDYDKNRIRILDEEYYN